MKWSVSKLRTFQNCRRQFWKKYILYDPPENAEPEVYQAGHEFHAMVKNILSLKEPNTLDIPQKYIGLPWEFEKHFSTETDGIELTGYADGFCRLSDSHVVIMEAKSFPSDPKFQLGVYSYMFSEQEAELPLITFLSITPTGTIESVYESSEEYLKYGVRFLSLVKKAEEEIKNFPMDVPNPGSACVFCQYRRSCPSLIANPDVEEYTRNPESLAKRLLYLETELAELKEIAKGFVEEGIPVAVGDSEWTYEYVEELDVPPKPLYEYLKSHGIDPFEIEIPRAKLKKSILKVDSRVFREFARKVDPDIANIAMVHVSKRFTRKKREVPNE